MKKFVKGSSKASNKPTKVKIVYGEQSGYDYSMDINTIVVEGKGQKETLMAAIDMVNLPYLGLDFSEPDEFDYQELVDAIMYNTNQDPEHDVLLLLEVNGDKILNSIHPEEHYTV